MKKNKFLTEEDFLQASKLLDCDIEAIKAVCYVEAPKGGFNEDDTPITLFEGHWFHRFTNGKYSDKILIIDGKNKNISYSKWTRKYYGKNQEEEKMRLEAASKLDRNAALMSASWGKFQIMGFNFAICGFKTIQQFVNAMYHSECKQLYAFCNYILNIGLDRELKLHLWEEFAYRYNGPLYKKNRYAWRLERAYLRYRFGGKK